MSTPREREHRFLGRFGLGGEGVPILRPEEVSPQLGLAPRLQASVRQRIRLLAVLALVGYAISLALVVVEAHSGSATALIHLRVVTLSATILLFAGALIALPRLSAERAIVVGLVFETAACLLISVPAAISLTSSGVLPPVTWVTPIIVMFPLLIPTPPRWTLVASIACALTSPLGVLLAQAFELRHFDDLAASAGYALLAPGVAVLFAYFGASTIYEIGLGADRSRRAGSYIITQKLGEGGMGEVYAARHVRLPRVAAIKFIRPEYLDARYDSREAAFRRFEREAAALVRLRDPHTVTLFDYDLDERGRLFYAMELLDGWNTDELVQSFGPLPPGRVVYLLAQACRSLAEAHTLGIVHRDIKPSNLMVCRSGLEPDFVKVMDFGILTMLDGDPDAGIGPAASERIDTRPRAGSSKLTAGGVVVGTADFMSPEQVRRDRLDGRSDIYCLGLVGYYLLTGTYVFRGGDPVDKMRRHLDEAPEPPSARRDGIPSAVEAVILGALEKSPERRPATAEAFARRLADAAVDAWTVADARAWWHTHRPVDPPS